MGWNSARWTSPVVPIPQITSIVPNGSTVKIQWDIRTKDATTFKITTEPTDYLVTSEYGFSRVVSKGPGCCYLSILGVPLGAHTFSVEARWAPDVKTSQSKPVTIAP